MASASASRLFAAAILAVTSAMSFAKTVCSRTFEMTAPPSATFPAPLATVPDAPPLLIGPVILSCPPSDSAWLPISAALTAALAAAAAPDAAAATFATEVIAVETISIVALMASSFLPSLSASVLAAAAWSRTRHCSSSFLAICTFMIVLLSLACAPTSVSDVISDLPSPRVARMSRPVVLPEARFWSSLPIFWTSLA